MPYLLQAAFWVGVVGTVAAAPLLLVLRMQSSGSYLGRSLFQWGAPVVLFLLAALAFATAYEMLPSSRWRTRIAGLLAGVITFFCFSFLVSILMNSGNGFFQRWPRALNEFALVFVLVGWIPLGAGWLAGWIVAKLPDTPANETP